MVGYFPDEQGSSGILQSTFPLPGIPSGCHHSQLIMVNIPGSLMHMGDTVVLSLLSEEHELVLLSGQRMEQVGWDGLPPQFLLLRQRQDQALREVFLFLSLRPGSLTSSFGSLSGGRPVTVHPP